MDALQYANLLKETIEAYGCPAIFNTDQGSQFTADCFINVLEEKNGLWRLVLLNSTNHLGYLFSGIEQKGL